MSEVPYYLRENVSSAVPGTVDIFNMENLDSVKYGYEPTSVWESIGENIDRAGDYVWDGISGTWQSVKSAVGENIESVYSNIKWELVFWVGIGLVIIFVAGRSGIFQILKP